jgi:hypothetical protein
MLGGMKNGESHIMSWLCIEMVSLISLNYGINYGIERNQQQLSRTQTGEGWIGSSHTFDGEEERAFASMTVGAEGTR